MSPQAIKSQRTTEPKVTVTQKLGPIITPQTDGSPSTNFTNINGPSLVRTPHWLGQNSANAPLGKYYLYFADHKGDRIKLAYSNSLTCGWQVYKPGSLTLKQAEMLQTPPPAHENADPKSNFGISGYNPHPDQAPYIPSALDDKTIPHIASPEVLIDTESQLFIMYFHGLHAYGEQRTKVAFSRDGIHFTAYPEVVGWPYLRIFEYNGQHYGLSMPGIVYAFTKTKPNPSQSGLNQKSEALIAPLQKEYWQSLKPVNQLLPPATRHSAVLVRNRWLLIFHSTVGDTPERIKVAYVKLSENPKDWQVSETIGEVLRPTYEWEGAQLPRQHSSRSAIGIPVNQVRDPAIFLEDDRIYMLYSIKGENGIAIAELEVL